MVVGGVGVDVVGGCERMGVGGLTPPRSGPRYSGVEGAVRMGMASPATFGDVGDSKHRKATRQGNTSRGAQVAQQRFLGCFFWAGFSCRCRVGRDAGRGLGRVQSPLSPPPVRVRV